MWQNRQALTAFLRYVRAFIFAAESNAGHGINSHKTTGQRWYRAPDLKADLSVFCGASAQETNFAHKLGFVTARLNHCCVPSMRLYFSSVQEMEAMQDAAAH